MNTAGIGSIVVVVVGLSVFVAYVYMLRWIQTAPRDPVAVETAPQDEETAATEAGGVSE
jgi:hypothetical protein